MVLVLLKYPICANRSETANLNTLPICKNKNCYRLESGAPRVSTRVFVCMREREGERDSRRYGTDNNHTPAIFIFKFFSLYPV